MSDFPSPESMKPLPLAVTRRSAPPAECGIAMVAVLAAVLIITVVSLALIGLMDTNLPHASVQHAVTRSFYIAQAGLEAAKGQFSATLDPTAYATPARGVTAGYSIGRFTYWVDAGPAEGCQSGLKTLEAQGEIGFLGRTIWSRVRACAVVGTPFLAALFGVGQVQFQGAASRVYLAPYAVGGLGSGGSVGSFTEVTFADQDVRVNALSEGRLETVALRDGNFLDYGMYGFSARPDYNPNAAGATPGLSIFGDIIKAQPSTGPLPNRCETAYACLTVGNGLSDLQDIAGLRGAGDVHHVYFNHVHKERLPPLALDPETFKVRAALNRANADLNRIVGLVDKADSVYDRLQFYQLMVYLADHPGQFLWGPVYINGSVEVLRDWNLGGNSGNVTLAVAGDLVLDKKVTLTNQHDLSTTAGRRLPGIVLFSAPEPTAIPTEVCGGELVTGSGRLVLCEESRLTVDGLIYTQDGMAIQPRASVDQVGAMYHGNHDTSNPSFSLKDGIVTLRFDPLAMSIFGHGVAVASWQQWHGPGLAVPPAASSPAIVLSPPAPTTAAVPVAPEPPATVVPPHAVSRPVPAPSAATPLNPSRGPQHPNPAVDSGHTPATPSAGGATQVAHLGSPVVQVGRSGFRVQTGVFRNREYADDLVRRLRAHGYLATLVGGPLIRVWVGPQRSREAAERLAGNLRSDGFEAILSPAR